jgi:hypothetical protein
VNALSIALLALAIASPQADGGAASSRHGERLRVESKACGALSVFARAADDSLTMRRPAIGSVPGIAGSVPSPLETDLGTRSPAEGARRGFLFGWLGGTAAGIVTGLIITQGADSDFLPKETAVVITAIGGGLAGGLIGAVIGAILPGEARERSETRFPTGTSVASARLPSLP